MATSTLIGVLLALITMLPLAWKWQLGVKRMALLTGILALLLGLLIGWMGSIIAMSVVLRVALTWFVTLVAVFAFLAYRFYRDPERWIPGRDGVIVSPADGKVIYIRKSHNGMLPVSTKHGQDYPLRELTRTEFYAQDAIVLGISMNFLDVHVNRAPIAGRVIFQQHFPGLFGSLRHAEMIFENERATTVFAQDELQIAVVQIASRLVRQIVSFVNDGQEVALGQRFGAIRFGSQVDVVVPASDSLELLVQPGDIVKAGLTVIARYVPVHADESKIRSASNKRE